MEIQHILGVLYYEPDARYRIHGASGSHHPQRRRPGGDRHLLRAGRGEGRGHHRPGPGRDLHDGGHRGPRPGQLRLGGRHRRRRARQAGRGDRGGHLPHPQPQPLRHLPAGHRQGGEEDRPPAVLPLRRGGQPPDRRGRDGREGGGPLQGRAHPGALPGAVRPHRPPLHRRGLCGLLRRSDPGVRRSGGGHLRQRPPCRAGLHQERPHLRHPHPGAHQAPPARRRGGAGVRPGRDHDRAGERQRATRSTACWAPTSPPRTR